MRVHYWTTVSLRRLYIGQFLSLHFKNRDEDFLSKRLRDVSHDKKVLSCTMELPNESASFVMIFVLFCFHLGLICGVCFRPKGWKSFYSYEKNKLFSYDIIRGIQQATSISFSFFVFYFLGINGGIKRKHILRSLVADQSTDFLARSRVPPERINSREIGKTCQQKWKIQHQNHDDFDFLITYKREPPQRHD